MDFNDVYISEISHIKQAKAIVVNKNNETALVFITNGSGTFLRDNFKIDYHPSRMIVFTSQAKLIPDTELDMIYLLIKNPEALVTTGVYDIIDSQGTLEFFRGIKKDLEEKHKDMSNHSLKVYGFFKKLEDAYNPDYKTSSLIVNSAVEIINSSATMLESINDLANELEISSNHLIREFKKNMGITPGKYLEKVRLQRSILLMQHTNYSLDEISGLVGFSSSNYFGRVFKKIYGKTPNNFRQNTQAADLNETDRRILQDIESSYFV